MEVTRYNYYDILEINPHCAQHEITKAYEKARLTYSGANPAIYTIFSEEESREFLKMIEEAFSVLGNKTLRSLYDEKMGNSTANQKEDVSYESLKMQSQVIVPDLKKPTPLRPEYSIDEKTESEIGAQQEWDGAWLKKVREYKKLPLEKMSDVTKISAYYINALEKMDSKSLPAPVYVRGYVSQFAKTLGLNEKVVCESYMKKYKEVLGQK